MSKTDIKTEPQSPTVTGETDIRIRLQNSMPKTIDVPPPPKPKE